ncbi:MAG: glycoside hydrolase family 16 protein [Mucilaginibacter sp.]|jgi:beta-glucanase (GH16 family)|nr:glycoside hydrolase family 16 protein [Mucilaginibacter sp.]
MKTSTLTAFLLGGLSIVGISSCKKLSPAKQGTQTTVTTINPKTAATVCDYDFNESTLTSTGWTKSFDDEFDSDLSKWYAYTGGVQNELQCFEPANVTIVNGVLQIEAKKETVTGPTTVNSSSNSTFNYTSGSIVSNLAFGPNATTPKIRIVTRMKVASGYGLVSFFDSYGTNWPTNGQINHVQVEGNDVKRYETNYFYGTQSGQNLVNNGILFNPADQDLSSCWHVYVTEWTQNALNFYLDGQLVETKTAGGYVGGMFGKVQNLSLSLLIGGSYYSSFVPANVQTGTMYVDYVKVFTSK